MSGFNRILTIQPRQSVQQPQQRQRHPTSQTSKIQPQVGNQLNTSQLRTPIKRSSSIMTTAPPPVKKRVVKAVPYFESESLIEEEEVDEEVLIENELPANQQALYNGGYGSPDVALEEELEKQIEVEKPLDLDGKRSTFTKVVEESIEVGGFILPSPEKKDLHKSFHWLAGKKDGQYRVVLGYNTLFKPKNPVNAKTGEKADSFRWRVVRFENRYKDNFPYAEFPAKYIEPIIQALSKAKETYDEEVMNEEL